MITTNMKQLIIATLTLILVFSCSEEEKKPFQHADHKPTVDNTISTDFGANTFSSSGEEIKLLKELHICDPKAASDTDELHPSCSPRFFRFFKLNKKSSLSSGFVLLVKAGVNGFPLRRVLVFQRENDQLVKLNGFNGNLIERRPSNSGYDDLVAKTMCDFPLSKRADWSLRIGFP